MEIRFLLNGPLAEGKLVRAFKSKPALELFQEYTRRISKVYPCTVTGMGKRVIPRGEAVWVCHRGKNSKMLSSEQIAQELKKVEQSGARALRIIIGGADGFEEKEIEEFKANLLWSFGPLTLPHELAAVVAAEQIYRASTILRAHPYHLGH